VAEIVLEAEEVLELAEDLEEGLEAETIQEVIRGIGRDMAEEFLIGLGHMVLTGQGRDFTEDQGHLNTGQEHMDIVVHMEGLGDVISL
jgi:hypothetical protein